MEPARDRDSRMTSRRTRIALAIVLGSAHAGCSKLGWSKRDERPTAVLGSVRGDSAGSYSLANKAEPAPSAVDGSTGTVLAQAPASADPVDLMSASESDARPDPRLAAATVPNPARLIASAERRPGAAGSTAVDPAGLVAQARASLDALASYQLALHRQERVNGRLEPEEDVIVAIRREPRAVRLTWPDGPHKGREVLYRSDEPGGMMHVNMADSAIPVPRLSIPPESPMVMKNSRHPVTEAGFESIVASLEEALRSSGLEYLGMETPVPLDRPHPCLARRTPAGERWRAYLDPTTHLPAMVRCESANGDLQELYVFRDVRPDLPELAAADAFDPDARWGPPKGLFSRLSRGGDAPTPR